MASKTFTAGTVIDSDWLNSINTAVYSTLPTYAPLVGANLVGPNLNQATATSINKVSFTPVTTGATYTLADGKTLNVSNTLTFSGTDGASLILGAGVNNLSGTNTGDQLTFKTISVSGQADVVADTTSDTLTLIAGTGISLATDSVNDTVTFSISGTSSMVLLGQATVTTAVANIDFLNLFSAMYDKYIIEIQGVKGLASDSLAMRLAKVGSVDTGTVYLTPAANGSSAPPPLATLVITPPIGLAGSYTVEIRNVNDPLNIKSVGVRGMNNSSTGYTVLEGGYVATNVVSGFRLYWYNGTTFSSGTVRVYGIRNT